MVRKRTLLFILNGLALLGLILLPARVQAAASTPLASLFTWNNNSFTGPPSSWGSPFDVTTSAGTPKMVVSPTAVEHSVTDPFVHVFTVQPGGDLWDTASRYPLSAPPSWSVADLTQATGAHVSTAVGVGALYLGGTQPSTQAFALSASGGHLLSFTTGGDTGNWQAFDLSALSGSGAFLTTAPNPLLVGSTVHVYATDNNKHLHDFYKTITANWQDIDLTNQTGVHAIFGRPYFYGGNSIQTVSTSSGGDLLTFVQAVFSDGTINFNAGVSVTDLTQVSGTGVKPLGISSPLVVVGTNISQVLIFVDSTAGNLVEFFKTPTANWQVFTVASLGQTNLTPSAVFVCNPFLLCGLNVVTNNRAGQLTDYSSTTSLTPPFSSSLLPGFGGSQVALGDPSVLAIEPGNSPSLVAFNLINF